MTDRREFLKGTVATGIAAAILRTIVDLTTYDDGRDIHLLEEVSRKSGLTMIASTARDKADISCWDFAADPFGAFQDRFQ